MPRQSHRWSLPTLFILLFALLTGCAATIPDLKPFADGTAELRSSTAMGFSSTENSLKHMASIVPDDMKNEYETQAKRLAQATVIRIDALDAFVTYADRLDGIAASGRSQKEQVGAAADALSNLTSIFASFSPFPGSDVVVDILTGAGKKAAQYVTAVRTAAKLEDAVKQADPAIKLLAEALSEDLSTLEKLFVTAEPALRAAYRNRDKALLDYYDQLVQAQKALIIARREELSKGPFYDTPTAKTLESIDKQIAAAQLWRNPLVNESGTSLQILNASKNLIQSIRGALSRWQRAHSDLAKALAESRKPSMLAFSEAIKEIKDLTEKLRKLNEGMETKS